MNDLHFYFTHNSKSEILFLFYCKTQTRKTLTNNTILERKAERARQNLSDKLRRENSIVCCVQCSV